MKEKIFEEEGVPNVILCGGEGGNVRALRPCVDASKQGTATE